MKLLTPGRHLATMKNSRHYQSVVQTELRQISVENDIYINCSGNGHEAMPMDSEAFLDCFDSIDWNHPTDFYD